MEIPRGRGEGGWQKFLKKCMELNKNFQRGRGAEQKSSKGVMDIFWDLTLSLAYLMLIFVRNF